MSAEHAHPPSAGPCDDHEIVLWLLSPLLLRDDMCRRSTDPDLVAQRLSQRLGVRAVFDPGRSRLRATRIDSWQRSWGLPRPTLAGLAPGSVLVFELDGRPEQAALDLLAIEGLGERRAEGMGEVAVNVAWLRSHPGRERPSEAVALHEPLTAESIRGLLDDPYGRVVLRAALAAAIRRSVAAINCEALLSTASSRTQIASFRSAVVGAPPGGARAAARSWVSEGRAGASRGLTGLLRDPWAVLADGLGQWKDHRDQLPHSLRDDLEDWILRLLVDHWCQTALGDLAERGEVRRGA